jgi:hypothetical protein
VGAWTFCLALSILFRELSQSAQALGRLGGRMRARRLSARERSRIASLGGKARAASLQAARRLAANLRYSALLRDLLGRSTEVKRLETFEGRLPGIYPHRG